MKEDRCLICRLEYEKEEMLHGVCPDCIVDILPALKDGDSSRETLMPERETMLASSASFLIRTHALLYDYPEA